MFIFINCIKHITNYIEKHVILYNVFFLLFFPQESIIIYITVIVTIPHIDIINQSFHIYIIFISSSRHYYYKYTDFRL